jgi:protease-4
MKKTERRSADLQTVALALRAGARNALSLLPGERPPWVVVELSGHIVPRPERPRLFGFTLPQRGMGAASLESITGALEDLARAPWLRGVLFRVEGLTADAATIYALRRAIVAVRAAGKETTAYLTQLDLRGYYVASAAAEVVAPESADVALRGLGVSMTFLRDALARWGVRFEKLAIDEYKTAFDNLVRQEMSEPEREQIDALLDSFTGHYVQAVAESRRLAPEQVRALLDEGITSAARAREAGLVDRVAYEDEVVGPKHTMLGEARRFLAGHAPSLRGGRVALVSVVGGIHTGRSKRMPVPMPLFGTRTSGSETIVRALRAAGADKATAAVVLFVDSGGGSALASDLIWREVKRLREQKPVVAVMGSVAASGGYYVAAPASRIVAAPTTVTGSIGVLTAKLVLEDLYAKHGINAQQIRRGRFALLLDPSRPLDEEGRALLRRNNEEIYDRFVGRVAEGRGLPVERVREIARGRVWAGTDALGVGLVDELGDLPLGIARARELGRLGPDAPVWDVHPQDDTLLPQVPDPAALIDFAELVGREHAWLVLPSVLRFGG